MPKLALHFICKNEAHIVTRMLESAKPICDLIVVGDTGSADGTQQLILQFGAKNGIPTYVFERPFDNFGDSRNYVLRKLLNVVDELQWDRADTYGFWADCDETFMLNTKFSKNTLTADMYNVPGDIEGAPFARGCFFRLSRDFYWYGPVHETIMWKDPAITVDRLRGISVHSERVGHSWKSNLEMKYARYGDMLEDFIQKHDRGSRWIFYTAQCYFSAAEYASSEESKQKWLIKALNYYEERASLEPLRSKQGVEMEERAYAQFQLATTLHLLGRPWPMVEDAYLKSYHLDQIRGEAFMEILRHYETQKNWEHAYGVTRFAVEHFHGKNPLGKRFIGIEPTYYNWRFLWAHYLVCFYAGKKDEQREALTRIKLLTKDRPEYFTPEDLLVIRTHTPGMLYIGRALQGCNGIIGRFFHRKLARAEG